MLAAEHGNADVRVAAFEQGRAETFCFMSEQNADRKAGAPVEQINSVDAGFDGGDLVAALVQLIDQRCGVGMMFPGDGLFGAKRGFGNTGFRRAAGDAAEVEPVASGGVGGAEEGADVVEAADVIEEDGDGDGGEAFVGDGGFGGACRGGGRTLGNQYGNRLWVVGCRKGEPDRVRRRRRRPPHKKTNTDTGRNACVTGRRTTGGGDPSWLGRASGRPKAILRRGCRLLR